MTLDGSVLGWREMHSRWLLKQSTSFTESVFSHFEHFEILKQPIESYPYFRSSERGRDNESYNKKFANGT